VRPRNGLGAVQLVAGGYDISCMEFKIRVLFGWLKICWRLRGAENLSVAAFMATEHTLKLGCITKTLKI
jgi:hypothetical protein